MTDILTALLAAVIWIGQLVFTVLWWVMTTLLWAVVWFLLPFAILAYIALRVAESMFGKELVRGWIKRQSLRFGASAWDSVWGRVWTFVRRASFAVSVLPVRVVGWLIIYTVWHSIISLFWKPRWHPWTRAWARRWKPAGAPRNAQPSASRSKTAKARTA